MRRFQIVGVIGLVVLASLVSAGPASGQVTLDPAWPENPQTLGGDKGESVSVQQTLDGGYIVSGATTSLGAGGSDV